MINYENNRIIDFDSSICNYTEDKTTIHQFRELPQNTIELCFVNPEALLVNGNTLVVPEAVRLSDGTLEHSVWFDSFFTLSRWERERNEPYSLVIGKTLIDVLEDYFDGWITKSCLMLDFISSRLKNILLYEDVVVESSGRHYHSENGILYCNEEPIIIPPLNDYANHLELISDGDYLIDIYGGVYSKDGKRFIRWAGDTNVRSYIIRDGVEVIEPESFKFTLAMGCTMHTSLPLLEYIVFPSSLKKIGKSAFGGCGSLAQIDLNEGLEEIEDSAFASCSQLREIVFPTSLRLIGNYAFFYTGLSKIVIPKSIEFIGEGAFHSGYRQKEFVVDKNNLHYKSVDGILYSYDMTILKQVPPYIPNSKELQPDETCQKIICKKSGVAVFNNIVDGDKCDLDTSAIEIGTNYLIPNYDEEDPIPTVIIAGLQYELPSDSILKIKENEIIEEGTVIAEYHLDMWGERRQFYDIPEGVRTIENSAFNFCQFSRLSIPGTFCKFPSLGLWQTKEIVLRGENDNFVEECGIIYNRAKTELFFCCRKLRQVTIAPTVETIMPYAFAGSKIEEVLLPCSVTMIRDNAFFNCSRLKTVSIPESVCYLGNDVFNGCGVRKVIVPDGLKQKFAGLIFNPNPWVTDFEIVEKNPLQADLAYFSDKEGIKLETSSKIYLSPGMLNKLDDEIQDEFEIVELSRSIIVYELEAQRDLILNILGQKTEYGFYSSNSLIKNDAPSYACLKISNQRFLLFSFAEGVVTMSFENDIYWRDVMSCVEYPLREHMLDSADCEEISLLEKNEDMLIGRTIAFPETIDYIDDFIDEDTGEVFSFQVRKHIASGQLTSKSIDFLKINNINKVLIYNKSGTIKDDVLLSSFQEYVLVDTIDRAKQFVLELNNEKPIEVIEKFLGDRILNICEDLVDDKWDATEFDNPMAFEKDNLLSSLVEGFYNYELLRYTGCQTNEDAVRLYLNDNRAESLYSWLIANGINQQLARETTLSLKTILNDIDCSNGRSKSLVAIMPRQDKYIFKNNILNEIYS